MGEALGGEKLKGVCSGFQTCCQWVLWDTPLKHGNGVLLLHSVPPGVASAFEQSQMRLPSCLGDSSQPHLRLQVVQQKRLHLGSDALETMFPPKIYPGNTKKRRATSTLTPPGRPEVSCMVVMHGKNDRIGSKFPRKSGQKGGWAGLAA